MLHTFRHLLIDDQGAVLVEYGLLLALIATACIAVLATMGTSINSMFSSAASRL